MLLLDAVRENWLVLLIPVIAGLIGWVTNVAAVYMLFHPLEFVGIPPFLGWQGVIPNASKRMGAYLADLIATKLLDLKEVLAGLDADALLPTIRPLLHRMADETLEEAATSLAAPLWKALDEKAKAQVREAARKEVESLATRSFGDLKNEAHAFIDVARAIEEAIEKDKSLLNNLFLAAGSEEFKFIKISGLYFGFLFGIPQLLIWVFFPKWWTLPAAGVMVGYVTNWLAMKMIFEPKEPKKYGPFEFHGLFHKRQHEVAEGFSHTVSATILTPANVVEQLTQGEGIDAIQEIFKKHVRQMIAQYETHPMGSAVIKQAGPEKIDQMIGTQLEARLTEEGGILWTFVEKTLDVASSMTEKLRGLDPETFEGVLRPAFQQDEWKLIAVGAVLGGIAGWLQVVYMFGDTLAQ